MQPESMVHKVIVLGAAALDWIAEVRELPPPDGIVFADQYLPHAGGSGGNTAEGLARLGYEVRFLGAMGDDVAGQMLLQSFKAARVDTRGVRIAKGERSAACFIAVDSRGQRMIFALGGVALLDKANDVPMNLIPGADILYIADAYPKVALSIMDNLKPGARIVFSPGGLMVSAGREFLAPILEKTDVLILNQVEAESLGGETKLQNDFKQLHDLGPGVVLVTRGDQGVLISERGTITHVPAEAVPDVVDATGAGDAFSTGVVAGMLEGLDWRQSARLGCKIAALKILHMGSRSGLPDRMQIQPWLDDCKKQVKEVAD
jgi:ribokinase